MRRNGICQSYPIPRRRPEIERQRRAVQCRGLLGSSSSPTAQATSAIVVRRPSGEPARYSSSTCSGVTPPRSGGALGDARACAATRPGPVRPGAPSRPSVPSDRPASARGWRARRWSCRPAAPPATARTRSGRRARRSGMPSRSGLGGTDQPHQATDLGVDPASDLVAVVSVSIVPLAGSPAAWTTIRTGPSRAPPMTLIGRRRRGRRRRGTISGRHRRRARRGAHRAGDGDHAESCAAEPHDDRRPEGAGGAGDDRQLVHRRLAQLPATAALALGGELGGDDDDLVLLAADQLAARRSASGSRRRGRRTARRRGRRACRKLEYTPA